MKTALLITVAAATCGVSASAEARLSSDAEYRGYTNCLEAVKQETNGVVTNREYLIEREGSATLYYINATHWQDGERARIRIACETAGQGSRLISAAVEPGRYKNVSTTVRVEVAQK